MVEKLLLSLVCYVIDWLRSPAGDQLLQTLLAELEAAIEAYEGQTSPTSPTAPAPTTPRSSGGVKSPLPPSLRAAQSSVPTE